MTSLKRLGIWMDHSSAHLTRLTALPFETTVIKSEFTHQVKESSITRSENLMHNKEQQLQSEYFKNLSDMILDYDDVVIFGPTDAKIELFNILRSDHRFSKIKIGIKPTDKMTKNEEHVFIREYFANH